MDFKNIPDEWFCHITGEVMTDPVIASDGHTYERKAIEKWQKNNDKSPVTKDYFPSEILIPNNALKSTIEKMLPEYIKHGAVTSKAKPDLHTSEVELQVDSMVEGEHVLVNVSVVPPKEPNQGKRKRCAIICILDVSGSMDTAASQANADDTEVHGFTRLDLVKHSVNTVINSLSDGDYLALVPFSDKAHVKLDLTEMNAHGKKKAEKIIKDMHTEGSTNIWDGLRVGLDLTQHSICHEANTFVLLLTDGEPNINPPQGNLPTLQKYLKENPLNSNIHVFGYGYNLDTILLTGIAKEGLGSYGYIPDCSMVGTIFVNFLSIALATVTNIAELSISSEKNSNIVQIYGYENVNAPINLGGIQYGQTRDILCKFEIPKIEGPFGEVVLKYGIGKKKVIKTALNSTVPKDLQRMQFQLNRSAHIEGLRNAYLHANELKLGAKFTHDALVALKNSPIAQTDQATQNLIRDIQSANDQEGQVAKAFEKQEWYNKWGKHYIPALLRAHILQICTNFKDPGLQIYGGGLFKKLQNDIDSIFLKLPPPEPTIKHEKYVAPANMAAYYNYGGGCIAGNCDVQMADGTLKKVRDIKKGDKVMGSKGQQHKIRCVVATKVGKPIEMVSIGKGLVITPYHPVKLNGEWVFPINVGQTVKQFIDNYYNFVLEENSPSMIVNGVECICLGHNLQDNTVVSHEYLGTSKVIDDLMTMNGWNDGIVSVGNFERDPVSLRIIKILAEPVV